MAKKAKTPPKTPPKAVGNLSAAELARLCGMSLARVYAELAQGRSAYEIIGTALRRKQREVALLPADVDVVAPKVNGNVAVNGSLPTYSESLARKEAAQAQLKETELLQKRGELLPLKYVRLFVMRFLTAARDVWEAAPGELADTLAAETDPRRCEVIVRQFVDRVLEKLHGLDSIWSDPPTAADVAAYEQREQAVPRR